MSLAWREPSVYVAQFGARLRERGIEEPEPDLVTIALLDALDARGRLRCVDWRASAEDARFNVGDPLRAAGLDVAALLAWYDLDEWRETDLVSFLKKMGSALAAHGWALVCVDHGADEYPLTVVPFERVAELRSLVKTMSIAGTTLVSFSPSKKPAKLPQPAKAKPPRVHDAWTIPADSGFGDSITEPLDGPIVVRAGPPCRCIRLSTWPPSRAVNSLVSAQSLILAPVAVQMGTPYWTLQAASRSASWTCSSLTSTPRRTDTAPPPRCSAANRATASVSRTQRASCPSRLALLNATECCT